MTSIVQGLWLAGSSCKYSSGTRSSCKDSSGTLNQKGEAS